MSAHGKSARLLKAYLHLTSPRCFIGKRQLFRAISDFKRLHPKRGDVFEVIWKPFYLNPHARAGSVDKREAALKRLGEEGVRQTNDRISKAGLAEGVGINFKFGGRTGSSRDSHLLVHGARSKGSEVQTVLVEELFKKYFEQEEDITDHMVLFDAARAVGIDKSEASEWLADAAAGAEVDRAANEARENGITGVPHFSLNDRFDISGAQESLAFLRLFERLVKLEERSKA